MIVLSFTYFVPTTAGFQEVAPLQKGILGTILDFRGYIEFPKVESMQAVDTWSLP